MTAISGYDAPSHMHICGSNNQDKDTSKLAFFHTFHQAAVCRLQLSTRENSS
jgi:hypothetical protein